MEAQRRWRRLVRERLGEIERLSPDRPPTTSSYWDARARRFARHFVGTGERDPIVARVARAAGRRGTVLDVGSGPGRFALPVAARVGEVVAVDPSRAMLAILRREAGRRGLGNVHCVLGRWEDVVVDPADVVVCAHVLPLVEDAAGFLRRLDAAARRRAFLYLSATSFDLLLDPFWRHFHRRQRRPAPTYLDADAVLREIGVEPEVEIVEVPTLARYRDLAAAVRNYRDQLALPDTAEVRAELRRLLRPWLVPRADGLGPPVRTVPLAILSWRPGLGTVPGVSGTRRKRTTDPARPPRAPRRQAR